MSGARAVGPATPDRVRGRDRGSSTTELVILAPVVIVLLLIVVAFGRYAHSGQLVQQAAGAAARAAALAPSASLADQRARAAAAWALADAGVSCSSGTTAVDTAGFRAGGTVAVTVTCTADLTGLALAGVPGSATLTASASAPLETYRQFIIGSTTGGDP